MRHISVHEINSESQSKVLSWICQLIKWEADGDEALNFRYCSKAVRESGFVGKLRKSTVLLGTWPSFLQVLEMKRGPGKEVVIPIIPMWSHEKTGSSFFLVTSKDKKYIGTSMPRLMAENIILFLCFYLCLFVCLTPKCTTRNEGVLQLGKSVCLPDQLPTFWYSSLIKTTTLEALGSLR